MVDSEPAGRWAGAQAWLTGCGLRYDRTLTNARLQNRAVAVPRAELPLEQREGQPGGPELPGWAMAVPLQPGRGMDGMLILLTDRAPSTADLASLIAPAAALGAKVGRLLQPSERDVGEVAIAPPPPQTAPGELPPALPHDVDLNLLLSALPDGLVVADADRSILAANEPGATMLALLQPEVSGRLAEATLVEAHRSVLAGRPMDDIELPLDTEPRRYVQLGAAATPKPGTVLITLKDVTEERLIHERLLQSEKMASIGQLVSGVAHEINNPLTGITGFAQLLLQQDLPDEARRMVRTINDEAERASRIVQNLLSFARRRRPEKERVDLNHLIERVIELRSYELRVHNIEPRVRLAPNLAPVFADPHQIQQVLLNVIRNAEHAVQDHGGGAITCTTSNEGSWVRVVITDDGTGIRPENLRRIFDPFFTTKQVGEGTGLGLTISYGIIEEHGGRIDVDSQPGRGTSVKIDLPAAPDAPEATANERGRTLRRTPRRSILVIDDEPSIRDLLTATLLSDGHEVESAADGAAGLERLAARDFDLIITDVKMPGVDGVEFYRRVRAWDERVAARIIFTTGDMVSPATRDFLESISNPHLLKPFRLPDVRALVAQMLPR